jgi:hypothetical protein
MNTPENSKTKISSDAWRLANPLLHLCPLVTGLLALWAPADVLESASWLGAWCASLIARFPFLRGHGKLFVACLG